MFQYTASHSRFSASTYTQTCYLLSSYIFILSHRSNMSLCSICFYHMTLSLVLSLLLLFLNHFVWLKFNHVFYVLSQHLHLHLFHHSYIHLSLMPDIEWHCICCAHHGKNPQQRFL
ncbi:hypothetical protein VIGAN_02235200 [Vigna angularis var. angularis]|uniref:Uncharacterized protein n=1 Tax=Vigna angularis var. angularis TaxID=157739 RepID=A0A0S3RFN5_PHAAN|nr:hypothetical protein VIGAN_02235200 [Vigna angularis var. angularis]